MSDKFGKAEEKKKKKRSTVLFLMTTLEICFVFEQKRWLHALIRWLLTPALPVLTIHSSYPVASAQEEIRFKFFICYVPEDFSDNYNFSV